MIQTFSLHLIFVTAHNKFNTCQPLLLYLLLKLLFCVFSALTYSKHSVNAIFE